MKLAIVGTGMIVLDALPHMKDWGWETAAICATPRSLRKAQELAAQWGGAVYTDYTAMLAEVKADAVYIASPNILHASMIGQALEAGHNVIVEKPMTVGLEEANALAALAREQHLFLYEAITTRYQPDYAALREQLPRVGPVKVVSCNFSQYSSRYDAFCAGETLPVFDPNQAGGALMDLNVYNFHWLQGIFGSPESLVYRGNIDRGIDTSGAALLTYPGFQAVSIGAKDGASPCRYVIQGTLGCLTQETPANQCGEVTLTLRDGTTETFHTPTGHRMEAEFRAFARQIDAGDYEACYAALDGSLAVVKMLAQARQSAGIVFPAEKL